jgi:hypothetical protein
MSTKTLILAVTSIGSSDTTISSTDASTTKEFYSATVSNTSASTGQSVEFFLSTDATSAAGERCGYLWLDGKEQKKITFALPVSQYLIAKGSGTDLRISGPYIQRTGPDAA